MKIYGFESILLKDRRPRFHAGASLIALVLIILSFIPEALSLPGILSWWPWASAVRIAALVVFFSPLWLRSPYTALSIGLLLVPFFIAMIRIVGDPRWTASGGFWISTLAFSTIGLAILLRIAAIQKNQRPNKAPEPTPTAVTSPAAQEPRQP